MPSFTVHAGESEEAGNTGATLRIGGKDILPEDYGKELRDGMTGGYAVYDNNNKTLTFFNDQESVPVYLKGNTKDTALIWADQDLTILGRVRAEENKNKTVDDYGIYISGKDHTLTIDGNTETKGYMGAVCIEDTTSSLVVADGATLIGKALYDAEPEAGATISGIKCNGNMIVNGTIDMIGITHSIVCMGDMEVNGEANIRIGRPDPDNYNSKGIYMGAGSTLTMNYGNILMSYYGALNGSVISGAGLVMNGGNINVSGGAENDHTVSFENLTLNCGTFTVNKNTAGGSALYISGSLTVNGGQLDVNTAAGYEALICDNPPVLAEGVSKTDNGNNVFIKRGLLNKYQLWVGSTQVDEENRFHIPVKGGSASFDPETNILMLKDVKGVIGYTNEYILSKCMIYTQGRDLVISGNAVLRSEDADSVGVLATNASVTFSGALDISARQYGICLRGGNLKDIRFNGNANVKVNITPSGAKAVTGIRNETAGGKIILDDDAGGVKISVRVGVNTDGSFQNNENIGIAAYGDEYAPTHAKASVILRKGLVDAAASSCGITSEGNILIGPEADIIAEAADGHPAIKCEGAISFPEPNYTVIMEPENAELSADGKQFLYVPDNGKNLNRIRLGVQRLSVLFDMCGHGSAIEPQSIIKAVGLVNKPADPTEEGCIFQGWYTDSEYKDPFDFTTKIATDLTLYAKWKDSYTVSFNMCGHGTAMAAQKVPIGKTATKPADPADEDYAFCGWFTDAEYTVLYDFATPVTADITLYAKWIRLCRVFFDMQGHGTAIDVQKVKEGETAAKPEDPITEAYDFKGWYKETACTDIYDFTTPVTDDITLYAKWEPAISPLNPVPEINADTKVLYLVKGQSFTLPEGKWTSDQKKTVKITKKGTFLQARKATTSAPVNITNETTKQTISIHVKVPEYAERKLSLQAGIKNSPAGLSYDKAHYAVQWATSAPDVATVSANGAINAIAKGKATITAYINGKAYRCTVYVKEDTPVKERTLHLNLKKSGKVSIKGAKNKKAEWTTDDKNIAEVNKGKITAGEKAGTTVVTCRTVDEKTYRVIVIVEDPTIKKSRIEPAGKNKYNLSLDKKGDKARIEFNNVVQPVIFRSSSGATAYMDRDGNIVANGKGKATLKAKINGTTVSIRVNVAN